MLHNRYTISFFRNRYDLLIQLVNKAKISEAIELAKQTIIQILVARTESKSEAEELSNILRIFNLYILALRAKEEEKKAEDKIRKVELMLIPLMLDLEPMHMSLFLQLAIGGFAKLENYLLSLALIKKSLYLNEKHEGIFKPEILEKLKRMIPLYEQKGSNAIETNFKEKWLYEKSNEDKIDCETLTIFAHDEKIVKCPYDKMAFKQHRKGQLCDNCKICEIGYDKVEFKISY